MKKYMLLLLLSLGVNLFGAANPEEEGKFDKFYLGTIGELASKAKNLGAENTQQEKVTAIQLYKLIQGNDDAADAATDINDVWPNSVSDSTKRYPLLEAPEIYDQTRKVLENSEIKTLINESGYVCNAKGGASATAE